MKLKNRILSQENLRIKRKIEKAETKIDDKSNLLTIHKKSPR